MASEDEARERGAIEGSLGQWLTDQVWDQFRPMSLMGAGTFRPLYLEEAQELGYGDDDPAILLRRESDGKVFEAEIDVTVRVALKQPEAQPETGKPPAAA